MQSKAIIGLAVAALWAAPLLAFAQDAPDVTEPETFAAVAASSNMFEIESSQLALDHASRDEVRAFAEHMIEDHKAAGEKMKAAAQEDGITPPAELAPKEKAQLEILEAAEDDGFDEAYIAAQVTAHDEAVALFEAFSTSGKESALRGFAAETLPTLQEHQTAVHELQGGSH